MDTLLNPDKGLIIWTIVTFLLLVFILKKAAWGPLLKAISDRESRIKNDIDSAQASRLAAEAAKKDLDGQIANLEAKSRQMLSDAAKEGEALRVKLMAATQDEAQKLRDKTMAELAQEKDKLVSSLRQEVASLSVLAAEKLMGQSVDEGVEKRVLDGFLKDLEKNKAHSNGEKK
jgi:F-type H+-transporting ATPase subunit b